MAESTFKVDGGIEAVGIITCSAFKRVGGSWWKIPSSAPSCPNEEQAYNPHDRYQVEVLSS